jgi:crotonobetainyl-CoA:carnitine CoA-transferase CaiB-like acyl-CoA transferase
MSYDAPFAGIKVVDLSQGIATSYAGIFLAQQGASVKGHLAAQGPTMARKGDSNRESAVVDFCRTWK